jgi:conjugal transfer/entry exclusion protein
VQRKKSGETGIEKEACANVEQELRSAKKIERQIASLSKSPEDQIKRCTLATQAHNNLEQISAAQCPKQRTTLKQTMTKMYNALCTEKEFDDLQREINVRRYNRNLTGGGGVRG